MNSVKTRIVQRPLFKKNPKSFFSFPKYPNLEAQLKTELRRALLKRPFLPYPFFDKTGWKYEFESEGSLNRKKGSTRESLVKESSNSHLRKTVISPSEQHYAYILVAYSKEQGNLIIRSFRTGLMDVVIKNVFNFCWIPSSHQSSDPSSHQSSDPSSHQSSEKIIFTRLDASLHSSKVFAFDLESRFETLIYSNPSKIDFVDIYSASDQSGAFISCSSKHSSESLYVDLNLKITGVMPRAAGKVYHFDRFNNDWIVVFDNNKKQCFLDSNLPLDWLSLNRPIEFDKPILDVITMKTECTNRLAILTTSEIYIVDCKSREIVKTLNLEEGSYMIEPTISQNIPSSVEIRFSSPLIISGRFMLDISGNRSFLQNFPVDDMDKYIIETLMISKTLVTLIYTKNRSRKRPCLLYSYGVYKERIELSYRYHHIPLLERGFAIALLHLEVRSENKLDTSLELIAIAKSLNSTSTTLIHETFSAGCSISAAAINLEPYLFDSIVWRAPFLNPFDSMMNPDLPLSLSEIEEWGDPINNQDDKSRLFNFSPFQNMQKSSSFPHLFITHGLQDERVSFQQSVDYINRARTLVPESTRLILNLVENQAHTSQTLMLDLNEKAKELAFILECTESK